MSIAKVTWHFEAPISLNATYTANITWLPSTFNTVNFGNFSCNVWLLRSDDFADKNVIEYDPVLLAGNHNVFNNVFQWTPSEFDIDFQVPHAGTHQLAWERTEDNPKMNLTTAFKGFSKGFNVFNPNVTTTSASSTLSTSSASSTPSTSSTSSSSPTSSTQTSSASTTSYAPSKTTLASVPSVPSTPQNSDPASGKTIASASSGGVSQGTVIGLGVAFGGLALLVIITVTWWYSSRYSKRKAAVRSRLDATLPRLPPYKEELDANGTQIWRMPTTPVVEIHTAERPPTPTHHEMYSG